MRPVQIIQAASAGLAALVITFLQPQREQIGVLVIGVIALLILAIGYAISHAVTALIQKKRRAYISNGIILVFFAIYIFLCVQEFPKMAERAAQALIEPLPKGANNTFDLIEFGMLSSIFLIGGGLATLAIALAHKRFKNIYRDNLISAVIFLVFGIAPFVLAGNLGNPGVAAVGFLNAACIFTAVHLGIAAASPKAETAAKAKA